MNLEAELLKDFNKAHIVKIANYIGKNEQLFDKLMQLFLQGSYRISQRASSVLSYCTKKYPALIGPHLPTCLENLKKPVPDAIKRNTIRMLQHIDIPEELLGTTAESCFKLLSSRKEPVAVKVFAMTVLANIIKKEPGLEHD